MVVGSTPLTECQATRNRRGPDACRVCPSLARRDSSSRIGSSCDKVPLVKVGPLVASRYWRMPHSRLVRIGPLLYVRPRLDLGPEHLV